MLGVQVHVFVVEAVGLAQPEGVLEGATCGVYFVAATALIREGGRISQALDVLRNHGCVQTFALETAIDRSGGPLRRDFYWSARDERSRRVVAVEAMLDLAGV